MNKTVRQRRTKQQHYDILSLPHGYNVIAICCDACFEDMDFSLRAFWVGDAISFLLLKMIYYLVNGWLLTNEYYNIDELLLLLKYSNSFLPSRAYII